MNLQEHLNKIRELSRRAAGTASLEIRIPAANELRASTINRISVEGKATDGSNIGTYDKKPAYYSRKQFVKRGAFKGQGKRGFKGEYVVESTKLGKFNTDTGRFESKGSQFNIVKLTPKSMYIDGGYTGFRSIQGRQTAKVDLTLSGDLMLNYQQKVTEKETLIGFTKKKESDKRKGNEERFGKIIFQSSKEELNTYNKNVAKAYLGLVLNILR